MTIRMATSSDIENISNLVKSLSHHYLKDKGGILPQWFHSTLTNQAFLERIKSSEYLNYVFENNYIVIGYLAMKNKNKLYHLFVSEEHQGHGVARKLWGQAIKNCKNTIYTLRSSLNAVPIYKKFGFIEIGEPQEKNGIGYQEMELRL